MKKLLDAPNLVNELKENCKRRYASKDHVSAKENRNEIWKWYSNLEKDTELADNIKVAAERLCKGFKLRRVKL